MKIFLTGGTGYIGTAVLERLIDEGHEVTAAVRSQASADAVQEAGATASIGDLFDASWVASQLAQHDAAIHTAAGGDERDPALDNAVIDAAIEAFGGTDKHYVHTGGIWVFGDSDTISEDDERRPADLTAWRVPGEQRLLDSDVQASVVHPGVVYGRGTGIPAMLAGGADEDGTLTLFGDGDQHWTSVHVVDLADLYVRAVEQGRGGVYVGASGENPTVRELAEAVTASVAPESDEATVARLGAFGAALLLDQQASGAKAKSDLGWNPSQPTLVALLAQGYSEAS